MNQTQVKLYEERRGAMLRAIQKNAEKCPSQGQFADNTEPYLQAATYAGFLPVVIQRTCERFRLLYGSKGDLDFIMACPQLSFQDLDAHLSFISSYYGESGEPELEITKNVDVAVKSFNDYKNSVRLREPVKPFNFESTFLTIEMYQCEFK